MLRTSPLPRRSLRGAAAGRSCCAGALGSPGVPGRKPATQCARQMRPRSCPLASLSPRALRSRPAPNEAQRRAPPARAAQRCRTAGETQASGGVGKCPRLCSGRGEPTDARLTLLLGSMAALRRRLWLRAGDALVPAQDPRLPLLTPSTRSAIYRTPAIGWRGRCVWGCGQSQEAWPGHVQGGAPGGGGEGEGEGSRPRPCCSCESALLPVPWVRGECSLCDLSKCLAV